MPKLVKLTDVRTGEVLYINFSHIVSMQANHDRKTKAFINTTLFSAVCPMNQFGTADFMALIVEEHPEVILIKIGNH